MPQPATDADLLAAGNEVVVLAVVKTCAGGAE